MSWGGSLVFSRGDNVLSAFRGVYYMVWYLLVEKRTGSIVTQSFPVTISLQYISYANFQFFLVFFIFFKFSSATTISLKSFYFPSFLCFFKSFRSSFSSLTQFFMMISAEMISFSSCTVLGITSFGIEHLLETVSCESLFVIRGRGI